MAGPKNPLGGGGGGSNNVPEDYAMLWRFIIFQSKQSLFLCLLKSFKIKCSTNLGVVSN